MVSRRNRFETTILAALPLLVIASVVCPACSAASLGVESSATCARPSAVGDGRADLAPAVPDCHTALPVAVATPPAEASCCLAQTAEESEQPVAGPASAVAWTAALAPSTETAIAWSSSASPRRPSASLGTPLYRLHRALLI